ncbi:MAG: potassium channel family protein [Nocardioides sp.]
MPGGVLACLGAAGIVLALLDVFYTVLFPASGHGPLREPLAKGLRRLFRLTRHLSARRRRRLLAYAGPVQIAVTIVVWFTLLLVAWAAVYRPALGSSIVAASGPTQVGWGTALYFSGFALTTLGTGDVVATTSSYRLFTIVEAATGFATITLVISYFISVYSALTSRNAFAMALHQRSGGTGRGDRVVAALWQEGDSAAASHLEQMASGLREIAQTHRAYPVLRSFHYRQDFDALPRVLLTCLETSTLLSTTMAVDRDGAATQGRSPLTGTSVREIHDGARAVRSQLLPQPGRLRASDEQRQAWAAHHREAVAALEACGVPVRTDRAATDAYVDLRAEWDPELAELADALLYDWPDELPAPSAPGERRRADATGDGA